MKIDPKHLETMLSEFDGCIVDLSKRLSTYRNALQKTTSEHDFKLEYENEFYKETAKAGFLRCVKKWHDENKADLDIDSQIRYALLPPEEENDDNDE